MIAIKGIACLRLTAHAIKFACSASYQHVLPRNLAAKTTNKRLKHH